MRSVMLNPATVLALAAVLLSGCASTPQADTARNAEAMQYGSSPASSTLYVYRPDFGNYDGDTVLWIDGRLIGATLPKTFFRVNLEPGKHTLTGMGYDNGRLTIETRPGALYFVALSSLGGTSHFLQVSSEIGRQAINRCCALMENWAPGQRPLLR
ncbi:MAG: hypothetical protein ABL891_16500 [Burkholderiales bacterium]